MKLVCEDCGETNPAGTEFCLFCGAYLSWTEPTTGPGAETVVITPPPRAEPSARQVRKPVEEVVPTPPPRHPGPRFAEAGSPAPLPQVRSTDDDTQPTPEATPTVSPVCPTCGAPTAAGRYFCGRCGHQLQPSPSARRLPAPRRRAGSWWARFWDSEDRTARRAFRRSLPAVYRWRRVGVGVALVALLASLGVVSRGRPVAWAHGRLDDLRGSLVLVPQVQATVEPAEATVPPSTPGSLLDRTSQAWTTRWTADTRAGTCSAPATPTVVLTFSPARRIRAIEFYSGLSDRMPKERALEFRPTKLAVGYGNGRCLEIDVPADYKNEKLDADSKEAVTSVRVSVMAVQAPPPGSSDRLSISEIGLRSRPDRLSAGR